jgi:uncharacterized membrane protein YvlD (DUF360 family)
LNKLFALLLPDPNFILLQSLAVVVTAMLLKNLSITSILGPVITAISISWFNNLYWDSSLFFGLPSNFTFKAVGLLFCNSIFLWIIIKISPGIRIKGIFTAIKASIVLSLSSYIINTYLKDVDWELVMAWILEIIQQLKNYFLNGRITN